MIGVADATTQKQRRKDKLDHSLGFLSQAELPKGSKYMLGIEIMSFHIEQFSSDPSYRGFKYLFRTNFYMC